MRIESWSYITFKLGYIIVQLNSKQSQSIWRMNIQMLFILQITEDEIMSERFSVSTLVNDGRLYYRVYDKKTEKIIECNVGELNQTIWKLLEV